MMTMIKNISFENYKKYFYDIIAVNTPNNKVDYPNKTPIFYKVEYDVLVISFSYSPFFIETKIQMEILRTEYVTTFDPEIESEKQNPADFMEWVQEKYLDSRGIEEI